MSGEPFGSLAGILQHGAQLVGIGVKRFETIGRDRIGSQGACQSHTEIPGLAWC
jgi:hypothetical protein